MYKEIESLNKGFSNGWIPKYFETIKILKKESILTTEFDCG